MTRRRKIQLLSVTLASLLVLGGTTLSGYMLAGKYRSSLEYTYQRALNDLGEYVTNMESTLSKAVYANTPPQQNGIAARLMRDCSGAKAALSALPVSDTDLSNVNRFVSQVGDFSIALSSKVNNGQDISEEEYQQLEMLGEYARKLQESLMDIESKFSAGSFSIGQAEKMFNNLNEETIAVLSDNFEETAKDFADYPTLIYDGPFSDHIGQQKPKFLEDKSQIAQGNAENTAIEFFNIRREDLTHVTDTEGGLPTYNFQYGDARISITKAGGYVASMINPREIGEQQLEYQDALQKAQEFLQSHGITGMKDSYYVINDNKCVLNFAYAEGDLVFYPDLIKVAVALDNGEIVEFNATGYLMNHHNREEQTGSLTQEQAQEQVSSRLTVENARRAVIPTSGLNEVYCYEFLCHDKNDQKVLVYINANTGNEEQILILTSSDNGVLTK